MKTLLIIAAALVLTCTSVFATGATQLNSTQTGVINFTNGGPWAYTNTFPVPFSYPPIFSAYLTSANTNALPFTNTITATNYIVTENSTAAGGTNATIVWIANPAAYIIQSGSVVALSTLATTNIYFPLVYTYPPTVVCTGSITNPIVSSVTISNFTCVNGISNTVQWVSFGADAARSQTGPAGTDGVVTH